MSADGATPLHAAAFVGDAQAEALLSLGADPAAAGRARPDALCAGEEAVRAARRFPAGEDALQNPRRGLDYYYYLDAVKRGDSAEAGIALEKAVADALGQGAAVVPACGETRTECDGYVLDGGAAASDGEPDYDSNAEDAPANDYPDEDEDRKCRRDDEVSTTRRTRARPRSGSVQPAWAEDHPGRDKLVREGRTMCSFYSTVAAPRTRLRRENCYRRPRCLNPGGCDSRARA